MLSDAVWMQCLHHLCGATLENAMSTVWNGITAEMTISLCGVRICPYNDSGPTAGSVSSRHHEVAWRLYISPDLLRSRMTNIPLKLKRFGFCFKPLHGVLVASSDV